MGLKKILLSMVIMVTRGARPTVGIDCIVSCLAECNQFCAHTILLLCYVGM